MPIKLSEREYSKLTRQPTVEAPAPSPEPAAVAATQPAPASSPGRSRPLVSISKPGLDYWSYIGLSVIVLFLLYIVKAGSFKKWVSILLYDPSTTPQVETGGGGGAAASPAGALLSGAPVTPANIIGDIAAGKSPAESISKLAPMVQSGLGQFNTISGIWDWTKSKLGL